MAVKYFRESLWNWMYGATYPKDFLSPCATKNVVNETHPEAQQEESIYNYQTTLKISTYTQ